MKNLHALIMPVWVLALAIGISISQAQEQQKPVPKAPYVAPVPADAHWLVTLNSTIPPAAAAQMPSTIDTFKTGGTRRVTLSFKDGTRQRIDQANGYFLTSSDAGPQISTASRDFPPYPFYSEDFLFVENIGPATFSGVVSIKGRACFYYQSAASEAWIDIESMLPIAAKKNGITAYFQFLPPPTTPLTLPPDEAAILERQQKASRAAQSMR